MCENGYRWPSIHMVCGNEYVFSSPLHCVGGPLQQHELQELITASGGGITPEATFELCSQRARHSIYISNEMYTDRRVRGHSAQLTFGQPQIWMCSYWWWWGWAVRSVCAGKGRRHNMRSLRQFSLFITGIDLKWYNSIMEYVGVY